MTQESVFDQPMKSTPNLPFEVIAVPQYDNTRLVNSANYNLNDPINIKIRIRNKEEKGEKYGIVSAPKLFAYNSKKVRLVSSDQTIMSFDLFVEPNTSKKIQKKSHKNFFHFFKPRGCLRIQNENDDKSSYLPGATNDVAMIKSTCSIVETNNISEKNVLKKNFPRIPSSERIDKQLKAFMGICKPGGCLDPPFNEDKYSYKPALEHSSTSLKYKTKDKKELRQEITSLYTDSGVKIKMKETSENNGKPQLEDNGEPDAHSLITYPTSSSSNEFRVHKESRDMKLKSRLSSENKARISMNEFSEIFFMPPKKEKSKSKGENLTGKVCMIKDTDIDTVNHSTESLTVIIQSKSLIEGEQENAKYVELIENIKSPKENLHNIDTDVNTVLNTRSQDLLNIKYTAEFLLENKVSNIQNYAYDKSIINTDIQKKETKEQDDFAENYKETNKNKNEEAVDIDDVKLSLKNITIQKSNSITIANPVNKTKDLLYSFSESINTLVKEHKEIADMGKLIDPSFKSKEFQNTDLYTNTNYIAGLETEAIEQHNSSYDCKESFKKELEENNDTSTIKTADSKEMQNVELNNNVNYQIIESKEFKDSVQESRESFKRKLEDITNAAEIKATLLKSKHDDNLHTNSIVSKDVVESKESQYSQKTQETSLKLSIDDPSVNELKNTFITSEDIDEDNLETNKTTDNYFDRDKNVEFYQNLNNNLPDAYQTVFSSDKNIDIETCNKENLISTSKPEKGYVQELVDKNLGKDIPLTSNNAETDSRIESIPFTETPRQASEVNSTRKQMSLILIRDEQVENIFRSTHVDKKDSPIENLKHFYSSESVTNALESNRNINDINKDIGGSCKSENSIIHKNLKPLDDESLQIKVESSSKIVDVNECNNNRPDFRVANSDNEDYTKTVNLTNLEHLQNVYLKQSDTNNIEKPFDEDFATTMYSSIAIDFGFRYSVDNDKLIIKSVDTSTPLNKGVGDKISIIKSMIRPNGDEIRIPIDLDIDLALVIKKASNEVTTSHMEHKSEQKINEKLVENTAEKEDFLQETLSSVYKTLVPINMIIQKLREEANILSRQQTSIKETLKIMEKKPMRLIHTNALCGCRKK
ncbi:MATH and LRR domain-containing protein PFE0570w-like [Vanessa cardui]|uniref:MATH and LRR domain-containing protein PFE0570w-like n=1 Tax=Vanessa cardui TaxID=171605 RepID=UPI001F13E90A|nr:MATH and LRR domain-containing protein PFE0570w-like [Vanessa cardui]